MDEIEIDFRAEEPIYLQIIQQIESQVLSGLLKPGDQLPPVRELAQELNVNFNTVARAYRMMDENGLISTQQGRGTFLLELPSEEKSTNMRYQALNNFTRHYIEQAFQLGFSPKDIIDAFENEINLFDETAELNSAPADAGTDDVDNKEQATG